MKLIIEEYLKDIIKPKKNKDGVSHHKGKINDILPLSNKMKVGKERFPQVLGEFTRLISQLKYNQGSDEEVIYANEKPIITKILKVVDCENDDDRFDINFFLENYLFENDSKLKQIHPYIFNYNPLSDKKVLANEEKEIAKFMVDVLIEDTSEFKHVFQSKDGENLLTSLVLENLEDMDKDKESKQTYKPLINVIAKQFKEDFTFICTHRDYFLKHYQLLSQYYYFFYLSQLTLKFSQYDKADYDNIDPLYFALDWETINSRRKSANDYDGYKILKRLSSGLFIHRHAMFQLSYNSKNEGKWDFMTYRDLVEELNDAEAENDFLKSINEWISRYTEEAKLKQNIRIASNITDAFEQLFNCLREGMNLQYVEGYGKGVEDAAVSQFLKLRGNFGYILNLKQDFLLLLTAISVKKERIPLKQLFEEFEKRGVALDRYSKKEVITLLDNLNIIDKKSDSGDAQYVKPIL